MTNYESSSSEPLLREMNSTIFDLYFYPSYLVQEKERELDLGYAKNLPVGGENT